MKTIFIHIILLLFAGCTMNSFAGNFVDREPQKSGHEDKTKDVFKLENTATLNSTIEFSCWYYVDFEPELNVTELSEINYLEKVSWMFAEREAELKVLDYKPTEEWIPEWLLIEDEPELKVTDLKENK